MGQYVFHAGHNTSDSGDTAPCESIFGRSNSCDSASKRTGSCNRAAVSCAKKSAASGYGYDNDGTEIPIGARMTIAISRVTMKRRLSGESMHRPVAKSAEEFSSSLGLISNLCVELSNCVKKRSGNSGNGDPLDHSPGNSGRLAVDRGLQHSSSFGDRRKEVGRGNDWRWRPHTTRR